MNVTNFNIVPSTGFAHDFAGPQSVQPGAPLTVNITFIPSAATSYSATVSVSSDAIAGTSTMSINGSGYSGGCGSFTDPRDGDVYQSVQIGSQCWMAENLRYEIPSGTQWHYFQNCYQQDNSNCDIHGKLYY